MNDLISQEWYEGLIEDCRAIITEAVFTSRWALVEGYHQLGERIREDDNIKKINNENINGYSKELTILLHGLAVNIGISERTLWYALQFYEKYPILNDVPEGKNISWNKIKTKYLPAQKQETPELPDGKYRVIYADPPWKYTSGDQHSNEEQITVLGTHYPSMSIKELCSLKIADIAQDNAVLFMWVTSPLLEECFEVINTWGFKYKASIVWNKEAHNVGHYISVRHEFLLICTRGSCTPDIDKLLPSVVSEKRTGHSVKPEIFRQMIDTMYPSGKRIELFARVNNIKNWESWGNESKIN